MILLCIYLLIYDLWIKIITVWNNGRKCLSKIFTKTENHGMIIKKKQKNPTYVSLWAENEKKCYELNIFLQILAQVSVCCLYLI